MKHVIRDVMLVATGQSFELPKSFLIITTINQKQRHGFDVFGIKLLAK